MLWYLVCNALGLLVALVGLVYGIVALIPRRVGSTPRCAHCGYDLTGTLAAGLERCSECGADLGGRTSIVSGRLRMRWRRVLVGAGVIALAFAVVALPDGIRLTIHWLPSNTLLTLLGDGQPGPETWAYDELTSRDARAELTREQRRRIDQALLRWGLEGHYARDAASTFALDRLVSRWNAGELHAEERALLFDVCLSRYHDGYRQGFKAHEILVEAYTTQQLSQAQIERFAEITLSDVDEPFAEAPPETWIMMFRSAVVAEARRREIVADLLNKYSLFGVSNRVRVQAERQLGVLEAAGLLTDDEAEWYHETRARRNRGDTE